MKAVLSPTASPSYTLTISMNAAELDLLRSTIGSICRRGTTQKQALARNLHKLLKGPGA